MQFKIFIIRDEDVDSKILIKTSLYELCKASSSYDLKSTGLVTSHSNHSNWCLTKLLRSIMILFFHTAYRYVII